MNRDTLKFLEDYLGVKFIPNGKGFIAKSKKVREGDKKSPMMHKEEGK